MQTILNELKTSTLAYRTGRPETRVVAHGIKFYYSRRRHLTVYADDLRFAQMAARQG